MRLIPRAPSVVLLSSLLLPACDGGSVPGPPERPGAVPGSETRALVAWLERQGARISSADSQSPAICLNGERVRYVLEGQDLHVLEYASTERAESEASSIGDRGHRIGNCFVEWAGDPHFYRSGRLIVYYIGADAHLVALLRRRLGPEIAGL